MELESRVAGTALARLAGERVTRPRAFLAASAAALAAGVTVYRLLRAGGGDGGP